MNKEACSSEKKKLLAVYHRVNRYVFIFYSVKKKNTIRRRTYLVSMFQIQIFIFTRKQAIITFNIELAFNIYKLGRSVSSLKKKEAKREDKISEITKHIKDVIEKFRPIKYP